MAISYDYIEAEDQYMPSRHCFDMNNPKSKVISVEEHYTTAYQSTAVAATIRKPSGDAAAALQMRVRTLLEAAGFTADSINFAPEYNGGEMSVSVQLQGKQNLNSFIVALAADVLVDGETVYGVLGQDEARALIDKNMSVRNLSYQDMDLIAISTQIMNNPEQRYGRGVQPPAYKDVDFSGNPTSIVHSLREDGFAGKFAVEKYTSVTVSQGMGGAVQEKLQAAGFAVDREEGSPHLHVTARKDGPEASVDNICQVLAGVNLMPVQAVREISGVQPLQQSVAAVATSKKPTPKGVG